MAVISVSITESSEQVVSGIPRSIAIATNIPSTIFYTLDGTDPTFFSNIYTSALLLPYDTLSVTLKILASNGVDSSPIITEVYETNILNNARLPHSATDAAAQINMPALYPYGTNPIQPTTMFMNPGDAGVTVDNPDKTEIGSGYDGSLNKTGFTNSEYNLQNYSIQYSTTDALGQTGKGIGNLPANVIVKNPPPPPETSDQNSNIFDPRAMVIFQDASKENPNDPPHINRQFFSLENPERARDGNHYYNSGLDAPPVSGSFLRAHYNPRDNTLTHYYLDTTCNKWIISKAPFTPTGSFDGNLSGIISSREPGSKYVFAWVPFTRRVLF
jgi:hypothetical protein